MAVFAYSLGSFTGAFRVLQWSLDWKLALYATTSYLLSQLMWMDAWAVFLKHHAKNAGLWGLVKIGWASVCGSVTPLQLGSDALRVYYAKKFYGIRASTTLSAALFTKGLKFALVAVMSAGVLWWLSSSTALDQAHYAVLLSGFAALSVIAFAFTAALSSRVSRLFQSLLGGAERIGVPRAGWLAGFFEKYYEVFKSTPNSVKAAAVFLVMASTALEFVAVVYSFESVGIRLGWDRFFVLFAVFQVLERVPFSPRGVGFVEFAAYLTFSADFFAQQQVFTLGVLGAALVVFSFVRVIIPTTFSLVFGELALSKMKATGLGRLSN